jgi:hypothetical protein
VRGDAEVWADTTVTGADPVVLNVPNTAVIPASAVLTHGSTTVTAGAGIAAGAVAAASAVTAAGAGAGAGTAGAADGSPPAHPVRASAAAHAVVVKRSSPRRGQVEMDM